MNVFRHTGDLGDVLAALPVIRSMGGGQLILGNVNGVGAREPMSEERYAAIAPLIRLQPYITELSHEHDARGITHDLARFRETRMRDGEAHNLVHWQSDHFGLRHEVDLSPWLTGIEPSEETRGKVVFARTLRYRNPQWNWAQVANNNPNAIFVGLEAEWVDMCNVACRQIPWRKTSNLLEVAQLIKGSDLFISNQSVGFWIALGTGHPLILEGDVNNNNCVIRRFHASYEMGRFP